MTSKNGHTRLLWEKISQTLIVIGYCEYVAVTVLADGVHSRVKQCSEEVKQASAVGSLYSRGFRGTSASRSGRRHSIGQLIF